MSGAIWLASYPRSGNTWTRMALYSLHNDGAEVDFREIGAFAPIASAREQIDRALEVDTGLLTEQELEELRPDGYAILFGGDEAPRLSKVHDAWIRTPSGRPVFDKAFTRAAIYLVRDPRDVAISWARFMGWPIDRSIAFLCSHAAQLNSSGTMGPQFRQTMRSWSDHAASWIDESGLDPLVVRYEDQLADPAGELQRIAEHIGWHVPEPAIARAVAMTGFEQLAAKERSQGFLGGAPKTERFFHTGKSGTWREILSAEQAATLEREHGPMMARFGYL